MMQSSSSLLLVGRRCLLKASSAANSASGGAGAALVRGFAAATSGGARPSPTPPPRSPTMVGSPTDFLRTPELRRLENRSYQESIYKLGKHRSNALELVHQQPIIEVEGEMAICDGGGGALGHPLEYISLQRGPGVVEYCKYCGLRYTQKAGDDGHHH